MDKMRGSTARATTSAVRLNNCGAGILLTDPAEPTGSRRFYRLRLEEVP